MEFLKASDSVQDLVLQSDANGHLKHFLRIEGLTQAQLLSLLDTAEAFIADDSYSVRKVPLLRGKTIVNTFFESSTRTCSTFELASKRLSADVINFNANMAALKKGESLLDTLKNILAMGIDMFVVRHYASGAAEFIVKHLGDRVSIVNAGDGNHAHPTQALIDMLVIKKHKKDFAGLKVAIVGDILHSRVARSEIAALSLLGVKTIHLIAPRTLLPRQLEDDRVKLFDNLDEGLEAMDVIMVLRLQKERMNGAFIPSEHEYYLSYGVTEQRLKRAQPDAIVMHPGPINRDVEVSGAVVDGKHSMILKQVGYGVAVRMAVMSVILGNQNVR